MAETKAKVGDWVRIMRNGTLVLAEIRYVKNDGWRTHYTYDNHGGGDDEDILEVRSKEAPAEEVKKLQGIIMGTSTEARVTLGVNLRRYWSAEDQVMLGRMLFDEDVTALRAELAQARETIKGLRESLRDFNTMGR